MDAVGLTPSNTGQPGGKRTGQHMADYPTPGGPFLRACAELQANGFKISYYYRVVDLLKAAQENAASGEDGEAGEGGMCRPGGEKTGDAREIRVPRL